MSYAGSNPLSKRSNCWSSQAVRDYYDTAQFAALVGRSEFTVREWCRHGRLKAEKRLSGRGAIPSWSISHSEFQRYQREGLLPLLCQR